MKVLWIKDAKTGHRNKALGLLRALHKIIDFEVVEYDLRWRWSGARQLLSRLGALGLKIPVRWFARNIPDLNGVELILSAGGATQWPNAALAHQKSIKNVFLGSPRKMRPSSFSLIALHDPPSLERPYFQFEIIPSLVTFDSAEEAARHAGLPLSKDWGILIGGDGEGVKWSESDYLSLMSSMILQAQEAGVSLWVASSRRTPYQIEDKIRSMADESEVLAGACWYHKREPDAVPLQAMMGACSHLCVTADSMSMTHEAVSSGRPVLVIFPSNRGGSARLLGNLNKLAVSGNLICQTLPELFIEETEPSGGWALIRHDPTASLADEVVKLIKDRHSYGFAHS